MADPLRRADRGAGGALGTRGRAARMAFLEARPPALGRRGPAAVVPRALCLGRPGAARASASLREPLQRNRSLRAQGRAAARRRRAPQRRMLGVGLGGPLGPRGGARARLRAERAVIRQLRLGLGLHLRFPAHEDIVALAAELERRYQAPVDLGVESRSVARGILAKEKDQWLGGIPEIPEGFRVE